MVSDFSELKGKIFLSSIILKIGSVHLFFQYALIGIRKEAWKTKIQLPSTKIFLGPELWSRF